MPGARDKPFYPAISDSDEPDGVRPGLFPAAIRPKIFLSLWVVVIVALIALGIVVLAYRHAVGR